MDPGHRNRDPWPWSGFGGGEIPLPGGHREDAEAVFRGPRPRPLRFPRGNPQPRHCAIPFRLVEPEHTFRRVEWTPLHPPEDFSFSRCRILHAGREVEGWIYTPHPETKADHFQPPTMLEVLAPFLPGIAYGDEVTLRWRGARWRSARRSGSGTLPGGGRTLCRNDCPYRYFLTRIVAERPWASRPSTLAKASTIGADLRIESLSWRTMLVRRWNMSTVRPGRTCPRPPSAARGSVRQGNRRRRRANRCRGRSRPRS